MSDNQSTITIPEVVIDGNRIDLESRLLSITNHLSQALLELRALAHDDSQVRDNFGLNDIEYGIEEGEYLGLQLLQSIIASESYSIKLRNRINGG